MPNIKNDRKSAYGYSAQFHENHPERHQFFAAIIKSNKGDIWDALDDGRLGPEVGWHGDFMDFWMDFEVNKKRLTPEQWHAAKAAQTARQLLQMPPSVRGDTRVPAMIHSLNNSTPERNLKYQQDFGNRAVCMIIVRFSSGQHKTKIAGTLLSATN